MSLKYPIILVHGVILKDVKFFKAFGKIEKILGSNGYIVYTANTDGLGSIENNANQLKRFILNVLKENNCDKVNIIAHSKGGLDSKYMISKLDMGNHIASLTTLSTPHKGSFIATRLLDFPKWLIKLLAGWLNFSYKLYKDENPDALTVCRQLKRVEKLDEDYGVFSGIYCQSYSSSMRTRDDFIMGIPYTFQKHYYKIPNDGIVDVESAKFSIYKGDIKHISHSEIVDFMTTPKKRKRVHEFYLKLVNDLEKLGF